MFFIAERKSLDTHLLSFFSLQNLNEDDKLFLFDWQIDPNMLSEASRELEITSTCNETNQFLQE